MEEDVVLMETMLTKPSQIDSAYKIVLHRQTKVNGVVEYIVHYETERGRFGGFYSFSPRPAIEEFNRRIDDMWKAW